MAAVTPTTGQAHEAPRRSVAKTSPHPTARPVCSSRSAVLPSIAHKRRPAHQAATPVFTKSRARALNSAATTPYSSMLHCYKPAWLFSSHSSLITRHCLFNRQPCRLEITVTHTKETPATQINRQLSGTWCSANHNSPITNKTPSNRQWQILEFNVTHTKQTTAPRSNRHFLRCVNLPIQQSQEFCRTRAALEGQPSTLDFQPSPSVSNRNNTSFKIPGYSLKINVEPLRSDAVGPKGESRCSAIHKSNGNIKRSNTEDTEETRRAQRKAKSRSLPAAGRPRCARDDTSTFFGAKRSGDRALTKMAH